MCRVPIALDLHSANMCIALDLHSGTHQCDMKKCHSHPLGSFICLFFASDRLIVTTFLASAFL
jgi:hypothetical protein